MIFSCDTECDDTKLYGNGYILNELIFNSAFKYDTIIKENKVYKLDSIFMKDKSDTITFHLKTGYRLTYENKQKCKYQYGQNEYHLVGAKLAIETIGDFDDTHLNGSDISEYFLYDYNGYLKLNNFQFNYLRSTGSQPDYYVRLIKKPKNNKVKFKIYNFTNTKGDGVSSISSELSFY